MSVSTPPESPALDDVEAYLKELIASCQPALDPPKPRGRSRILPAMALWSGLVVCILRGFSSQRELWRLLASGRFWDYPRYAISDQAVYHRLERSGTAPIERLFGQITAILADRLAPLAETTLAPFASQVVVIDETTLDPVARRLPSLRGLPASETIPGKLAGRFDLRCQQWQHLIYQPDPARNEKVLARDLPKQSLILADLGYFGFEWFDDLTTAGHFWLSRLRAKTSYQLAHVYYQDGAVVDGLIWLGAHRADRARYLVRLLQFPHGKQVRRFITNVTDPEQLSVAEAARLYARRWDIEMAVQLVKEQLGVGLLWSAKAVVIRQQLWAVLLIAQIVQALRLEVAARAGVDLFDVSLPLLVRYLPRYAAHGHDPLAAFIEDGERLGFIRPSQRVQIMAPEPDLSCYHPPPPDLHWERTPRYARRKCESR